jgi:hypothetical protein
MPNRAKRAAARQTQLGQRRRKDRKERTSVPHLNDLGTTASQATLGKRTAEGIQTLGQATAIAESVPVKSTTGGVPAQPYLKADLTRVGIVTLLSTGIVVGGALLL